ncbi:hypothetical protein PENSTE_c025G09779 [Penicillium steckii]|uniref:Uncharacterized protein n=1 Tax=Penicillium steckii TaxID=303698 RepID=A0A1V6SQK8_9EURO|nr:hypothetical protein PENSTE_c025G09779 [Penicillium steckii]
MKVNALSLIWLSVIVLVSQFAATKATAFSPFYLDNEEYFMNASEVILIPYDDVQNAFKNPVAVNSQRLSGVDWTRPYPGSPIDGYTAYLEIAHELRFSDSIAENSSTVLSSLTFSIPDSMKKSNGELPPMDPSWYICRYVFISTNSEAKKSVDSGGSCDFLPQQCRSDLITSFTEEWGTRMEGSMCAALTFDPIPYSCFDSFGFAREEATAFNGVTIANATFGSIFMDKEQSQYSWRIGTGYHEPGESPQYGWASNRTYLVATVWGYGPQISSHHTPEVSLACISSGKSYIEPPSSPALPPSEIPISTTTTSPTTTSSAITNHTTSKSMARRNTYGHLSHVPEITEFCLLGLLMMY